jgi:hypothetical protein
VLLLVLVLTDELVLGVVVSVCEAETDTPAVAGVEATVVDVVP